MFKAFYYLVLPLTDPPPEVIETAKFKLELSEHRVTKSQGKNNKWVNH